MTRRPVLKSVGVVSGCVVLLIGVIGFAHTPAGRPLLGAMGRAFRKGACPLGYDRAATPQAREQMRASFARSHRGQLVAESRPALGFELDRTSRAEVLSFMAARGVTCQPATAMADLICPAVPGGVLAADFQLGRSLELWFNFGTGDKLIAVIATSREADARQISAAFSKVTDKLAREAGPATKVSGKGDAPSLAAGTLRQASSEFAFADYYALARATNMGRDFMLTEEYRSLPN